MFASSFEYIACGKYLNEYKILGKSVKEIKIIFNVFEFLCRHHLPDSPPDSGSEQPYSPTDQQNLSPRKYINI